MARYLLKRDVPMVLWGVSVVLPKGTPLILVKGADGVKGDLYAVGSPRLLTILTGNSHDPKYRYAFVDASDVETIEED